MPDDDDEFAFLREFFGVDSHGKPIPERKLSKAIEDTRRRFKGPDVPADLFEGEAHRAGEAAGIKIFDKGILLDSYQGVIPARKKPAAPPIISAETKPAEVEGPSDEEILEFLVDEITERDGFIS